MTLEPYANFNAARAAHLAGCDDEKAKVMLERATTTLAMAAERISTADMMRVGPTRGMSEEGKTLFGGVGVFGGSKADTPKTFLEMPPKRVKVSDHLYRSYVTEIHGRTET